MFSLKILFSCFFFFFLTSVMFISLKPKGDRRWGTGIYLFSTDTDNDQLGVFVCGGTYSYLWKLSCVYAGLHAHNTLCPMGLLVILTTCASYWHGPPLMICQHLAALQNQQDISTGVLYVFSFRSEDTLAINHDLRQQNPSSLAPSQASSTNRCYFYTRNVQESAPGCGSEHTLLLTLYFFYLTRSKASSQRDKLSFELNSSNQRLLLLIKPNYFGFFSLPGVQSRSELLV